MPGGVAHIMTFVLNPPMATNVIMKVGGACLFGCAAGDDPSVFLADSLPVEREHLSSDASGLTRVWKVEVFGVGDPG